MTKTLELPNDIKKCHELINELVVFSEQLKGDNEFLKLSNKELKEMLKLANYKLYGESSEKSKYFDEYLNLKFEQIQQGKAIFQLELFADIESDYKAYLEARKNDGDLSGEEKSESKPKKERKNKYDKRLTENESLPVEECRHKVELESCSKCHQSDFSDLQPEITREIEIKPAQIYIKEHISEKKVCNGCGDITRGQKPLPPLNKCCAGPSLLAHIAYSRFDLYLPYYRLNKDFKFLGLDVSISNLCNWMGNLAFDLFLPFYHVLKTHILATDVLLCDETTILEQAKSKCITRYLWAYTNVKANLVIFDYSSRSRENPNKFLEDYKNRYLLTDKYGGYDEICKKNNLKRAYCWVHARRKFHDIIKSSSDPNEMVAVKEIYKLISEMLGLDAKLRGKYSSDELTEKRCELVEPLIDNIYEKLDSLRALAKTGLSRQLVNAINYILNAKDEFKMFLRHPDLEPSNNASERNVRFVTIGRKNWLFTGSERGGKTLAIIASVIASAKMNGLNVREYLEHLIRHLPNSKISELPNLLPMNYKKNIANN